MPYPGGCSLTEDLVCGLCGTRYGPSSERPGCPVCGSATLADPLGRLGPSEGSGRARMRRWAAHGRRRKTASLEAVRGPDDGVCFLEPGGSVPPNHAGVAIGGALARLISEGKTPETDPSPAERVEEEFEQGAMSAFEAEARISATSNVGARKLLGGLRSISRMYPNGIPHGTLLHVARKVDPEHGEESLQILARLDEIYQPRPGVWKVVDDPSRRSP